MTKTEFEKQEQKWCALISEIVSGSDKALSELYDDTSHLVYSLAYRITSDDSEAQEASMDVYMYVHQNAGDFDPERSKPSSWLLMLTRSRSLDRLRSSNRRMGREEYLAAEPESSEYDPHDMSIFAQQREMVIGALSKLSPKQRRTIELAFYAGYTHNDISEQTGEPLGTVKSHIRLGMIKLREELNVLQ